MANAPAKNDESPRPRWTEWLLVLVLGFGLTWVFFAPLWTGGGLIGGDLYTYFMPQKQFYAERLADGEFPLWQNRSGYGYPLVAESQTGAFYPPHLLLYSTLDVTTAYNLNQLLHYVLTFLFVWLYSREVGVKAPGAILAALVYTYGWFPPRLCLEWAIIGGLYLPLQLGLVERFLKTGNWRYPIWMSVAGGTQLLAGHFNLAFIIDVVLVLYLPARLWFAREGVAESVLAKKPQTLGLAGAAIALGFAVAAAQLMPTWELKQASQRKGDVEGGEFDPGYGHIPPLYLSQVVASWWWWHAPEINRDQALQNLSTLAWKSGTNQAEAHLYFGLIPLLVVIAAAGWHATREKMLTRLHITWFVLGLAAIAYSTGWLIPILQHVPGFTFFRGPGRYGMVATLGMAVAAGAALHLLCGKKNERTQWAIGLAVLIFTAWEFHYISRHVTYAFQLDRTPIQNVAESSVRKQLAEFEGPVRLHAPGPNLTNLLGVSSVPEYLGLGPAEYYVEELKAPPLDLAKDVTTSREFAEWASRHGVTHVLSFEPLPKLPEWRLVLAEPDPFLNPAWARLPAEPIYLYRRAAPSHRAFIETASGQAPATITRYEANEVEIQVDSSQPGQVVLRDLMFPGWQVTVDGEPAQAKRCDRLFRSVNVPAGQHTIVWTYSPTSLKVGLGTSAAAILILLAVGHVRFWHFRKRNTNQSAT